MTEEAMFACAALAVEKFASMLKAHPRFEEDPVCVTATLAESYAAELRAQRCDTGPQKAAAKILAEHVVETNGHRKTKRNGVHR